MKSCIYSSFLLLFIWWRFLILHMFFSYVFSFLYVSSTPHFILFFYFTYDVHLLLFLMVRSIVLVSMNRGPA